MTLKELRETCASKQYDLIIEAFKEAAMHGESSLGLGFLKSEPLPEVVDRLVAEGFEVEQILMAGECIGCGVSFSKDGIGRIITTTKSSEKEAKSPMAEILRHSLVLF